MVSQRQKLARKRYKDANPELFPPPPPPDPKKKKKKTSSFKRKKSDPNNSSNVRKSSFKKHPLRVAGMKPGESCYICKAPDHIAKNCPQKSEWERNKICLSCRQRGHSLKNCPNKNEESTDMKLCYNCGEMGHSLSRCPQPLQDGMCSGIWKRRRWITDTEKCTQFLCENSPFFSFLSRSSLLLDLVAKGVMNWVTQEVKDLYHILEHEFLPIHLALPVQLLLTKISKLGGEACCS